MNGSEGGHSPGEVIGNKLLVSYDGKDKFGHHLWGWKCIKCQSLGGPSVISHMSRGTFCSYCRGEQRDTWKGYREISGKFIYQYRSDAKKKDREFSITPKELWAVWEAQDGLCIYSGRKLTHGVDASIDRIDSSLGYTKENVQWVHRDINRMKSDFSESEFLSMCLDVAKTTFNY